MLLRNAHEINGDVAISICRGFSPLLGDCSSFF